MSCKLGGVGGGRVRGGRNTTEKKLNERKKKKDQVGGQIKLWGRVRGGRRGCPVPLEWGCTQLDPSIPGWVLELIQRKATELRKGLEHKSDEEQLRELEGLSLEERKTGGTFSLPTTS